MALYRMLRLIIAFSFLFSGLGRADEDAIGKYRDFLPEQLLALPEDERQSSVPMMFSGAANLATAPAGD